MRPPIQPAKERCCVDSPRQRLSPTVAASLKQALLNIKKPVDDGEGVKAKEGDTCKNNGCKKVFPAVDEVCKYHPGYPVFHEVRIIFKKLNLEKNIIFKGLKYWSCCQRKTTEFQQFLDQEGCEIGVCKWIDDKGEIRTFS